MVPTNNNPYHCNIVFHNDSFRELLRKNNFLNMIQMYLHLQGSFFLEPIETLDHY